MTAILHRTLIHLIVDLVGGTAAAQTLLAELSRVGQIDKVSTVYKRYLGKNRADLNAQIEVVVGFNTELPVDELLWHFKHFTKDTKAKIVLLSYDDLVVLSPQLTLPHPHLHTDYLVIRCACEIWPHFEHPILQKSLSEMSSEGRPSVEAEFYLQGKSLVDF